MKKIYSDHGTRHRPSRARRQYRELRDAERSALPEPEEGKAREPVRPLRVCHCDDCVSLCYRNPGWMTPAEAMQAMDAGLAHRLMRDWLEPSGKLGNTERLYVLAAASIRCEGQDAPEFSWAELMLGFASKGRCTFLENDRCSIHDSGFKPKQCRESLGCERKSGPDNYEMARHWDSDEGRAALDRWSNEKAVS
jgi:Fe-S-cluster containining protein